MKKKNKKKGGSSRYTITSNFMIFGFILILCVIVYKLSLSGNNEANDYLQGDFNNLPSFHNKTSIPQYSPSAPLPGELSIWNVMGDNKN